MIFYYLTKITVFHVCLGICKLIRVNGFGVSQKKVQSPSVSESELLAVLRGLQYAWERRFPKLILELDSKQVVDTLVMSEGLENFV